MGTALTHIRESVTQQNSLLATATGLEPALHNYALAQKYGLRPEALQAARAILLKQSMITIEDFDYKLDIMPGASLSELVKYHERVWAILALDLADFMVSCGRGTIAGLRCDEYNSNNSIPRWLDHYTDSIRKAPNVFDPVEFNSAMVRHVRNGNSTLCECASIPTQTIREFWEALAGAVHGSFEKVSLVGVYRAVKYACWARLQAESALSLVGEREDPGAQTNSPISPPEPFNISDANLIIRSSDLIDFRVHKSVLTMVSPFFEDMLSLPQPSDGESVDGLPVVRLPEDSELLNSLLSKLYPVRTVVPNSYDKVLYLLAAGQH